MVGRSVFFLDRRKEGEVSYCVDTGRGVCYYNEQIEADG